MWAGVGLAKLKDRLDDLKLGKVDLRNYDWMEMFSSTYFMPQNFFYNVQKNSKQNKPQTSDHLCT